VAEQAVPVGMLGGVEMPHGLGDFGVAADAGALPPARVHLETLLALGGMRRVKLPLPAAGTATEAADEHARLVAGRFARQPFQLVGVVLPPPADTPERSLRARLRAGDTAWIEERVRVFGGYFKIYQIGADGDPAFAGAGPEAAALFAAARGAVTRALTFASSGLPVPAPPPELTMPDPLPDFVAVDASDDPARAFATPPGWVLRSGERRLTLRLRPLAGPSRGAAAHAQIADLARAAVEARRHGWTILHAAPLHGVPSALLDAEGFPTPAFHAWRTLNGLLSGSVYAGPAFAFADVESRRFDRTGREGVIALWSRGAPVVKELRLGAGVRVADLSGNVRHLPPDGRLSVGPEPVFLLGVNPALIEMLQRITVEPSDLTLREGEQTLTLTLRNTFPEPLRALRVSRIHADAPGWNISPAEAQTAVLPPSGAFAVPLTVRLPVGEAPGARELLAEAAFTADKTYDVLIHLPVRVLSPLDLALRAVPDPAAGGRRVEIAVANRREPTGDAAQDAARAIKVRLTVALPASLPEDQHLRLPPGATRTFSWPLRGAAGRVSARVQESGGDLFLDRTLDLK
jgi:hypothetical protein